MESIDPAYLGIFGMAALCVALTEAVKRVGRIPNNFNPLVAVLTGIVSGVIIAYFQGSPYQNGAFMGLVFGLSSMGIYSGFKGPIMGMFSPPPETPPETPPTQETPTQENTVKVSIPKLRELRFD